MALISISSINVALPTIESGLGATASQVQWLLAGYALTFGIVLVPAGRIGDVLGRGTVWMVGLAVFTLASVACGLAPNAHFLNLFRLIQGIGAGISNPQSTGMIQQYFSGVGRAKAYALFGMVVSASVAIGPVISGFVIQLVGPRNGWRASFLWVAPLGVIGLILAAVWFPFEKERERAWRRAVSRAETTGRHPEHQGKLDLDPVGMALLMISVLCIMLPFGSHSNPLMWLLLPTGLVMSRVWVRWEKHYYSQGNQPMVDLRLFHYSAFAYGTATSATMFLGSATIFASLAMYLQQGLGLGAFQSGLFTLPDAICSALASAWVANRSLKKGRPIIITSLAMICAALGVVIGLSWLINDGLITPYWIMSPIGFVGLGQGAIGSANQTLAMQQIPAAEGGTAGGIKQTSERVTVAMGNTITTTILFSLSAYGWHVGITGAYGGIIAFMAVSLVIAILDFRKHGAGALITAGGHAHDTKRS